MLLEAAKVRKFAVLELSVSGSNGPEALEVMDRVSFRKHIPGQLSHFGNNLKKAISLQPLIINSQTAR
jgi:hypothetical protein